MRYTISLLLASLTAPALAEVPQVVTDIPPVHSLVSQVMGDLGKPVLLLERGANAHDVTLKPSQIAALSQADLVVWIGPGMTPWLDRALDTAEGAQSLILLDAPGTETRAFGATDPHDHAADDHDHDHAKADQAAAEAGHDHEEHAEAGHDHSHTGTDPHAWLDPANARAWLGLVAARLAEIDPANAATYSRERRGRLGTHRRAGCDPRDPPRAPARPPLRRLPRRLRLFRRPLRPDHRGGHRARRCRIARCGTSEGVAGEHADRRAALHLPRGQPRPEAGRRQWSKARSVRTGGALDPEGSMLDPGPGLYDALLTGLADTLTACLLAES